MTLLTVFCDARLLPFLLDCRLFQVVGKIDDTLALLNLVSSPSLCRAACGVPLPGGGSTGLLPRPVPTRPLPEALGGQVGRPAWSDLLAVPPPPQACMMTITFLPFTVSAATSQASLRALGPPPGEGAHSPRRSPLRDADSRVGLGCTAGKRRGSGWQSYLPGEGFLGFPAGWRWCPLHAPARPQPSQAHRSVRPHTLVPHRL